MFLFFSAKCSKQANRMVLWSGTYDTVMCNGAYGSIGFWCLPCPIVTVANMFTFYFLLNFSNFWKVLRKQVSFLGGELLCILYIVKNICIHICIYIFVNGSTKLQETTRAALAHQFPFSPDCQNREVNCSVTKRHQRKYHYRWPLAKWFAYGVKTTNPPQLPP